MSGKHSNTGAGQPLLHGAAAPPPYGGTNHPTIHHHHHHSDHGVAYVPHVQPVPVIVQSHPTVIVVERPRCRFCRAFLIAIVVWFLFASLVKSTLLWAHWGHGRPHQWAVGPGSESPDYPIPGSVDLISCDTPLKDGGSSQTAFEVPTHANTTLLFANGSGLYGTVRVTTTSDHRDSVKYYVDLEPINHYAADTILCSIKRRDGDHGVGIFNPVRRRAYDKVKYNVVVEFPQNHPIVKRFESSVVNSVYNIDDLRGKITFDEISLHGTNGGIHVESLFAHLAHLQTSNGRIDGYFNASDALILHTSNSRVDVDVDFNQKHLGSAVLSIATTNSPLKAKLRLHDLTSSKSSTNFSVTTKTSNSPLSVEFLDAPVNFTLTLHASTSNSPAEVTLHPTYEGHFSLHSSLFSSMVHERPGLEDPSGRGRDRYVRYRQIRGPMVEGDVFWGDEMDRKGGSVDVGSSNARITLNL